MLPQDPLIAYDHAKRTIADRIEHAGNERLAAPARPEAHLVADRERPDPHFGTIEYGRGTNRRMALGIVAGFLLTVSVAAGGAVWIVSGR
jgi:hypothetical protein